MIIKVRRYVMSEMIYLIGDIRSIKSIFAPLLYVPHNSNLFYVSLSPGAAALTGWIQHWVSRCICSSALLSSSTLSTHISEHFPSLSIMLNSILSWSSEQTRDIQFMCSSLNLWSPALTFTLMAEGYSFWIISAAWDKIVKDKMGW